MPAFMVPLHEFNPCHTPAGSSQGGQFCSEPGGTVTGGGLPVGALPEAPSRYFEMDARTRMVPLAQMDTIRARPEGIVKAEVYMRKAYDRTHPRRKPITLRRQANGRYEVLDGNSTTAIARKHGWTRLPAHVED